MATLETLGVGSLSLKGHGTTYNRLSRFFATKAEADANLSNGGWVPVDGVLNACLTGDEGVLVYDAETSALIHADTTVRPYIDTKISEVIGGAPDTLNTLQELATALGDSPDAISTLQTSVTTEVNNRTTITDDLETRLAAAETTVTDHATRVGAAETSIVSLNTSVADVALKAPLDSPTFTTAFRYEGTHLILRDTVGGAGADVILEINSKDFMIRNVQDARVVISTQDVERFSINGAGNATFSGDVSVTGKVTSASGVFVQAHCSFDASAAGSFDFANDGIASHNIASVARTATGKFTVTFTNAMASGAYTVVAQAGDQDYSGVSASPRSVCVNNRTASSFDIIVERTDDAVNDDNGYVALMVMGTLA